MPNHDPAAPPPRDQKPAWLRKRLATTGPYKEVRALLHHAGVHTVCQEARCPNHWECFSQKTATFLILGDQCTRRCGFCAVGHGRPAPQDPDEPDRIARAVCALGLRYVVVTSVTRDDLPDGGASVFAQTIQAVRMAAPGAQVEVLIPDFRGRASSLETVLRAGPDVLNHNVETVPRLYDRVRPGADYRRSLALLRSAFEGAPQIPVKSGIMLGLGETDDEIWQTLEDLRASGCTMLTLGQYLRPAAHLLPVVRYVPPEEFHAWREKALALGFRSVASGPWVRSSYHARELYWNP
ncbi:MAG: lipoyl synthase [Desulfosoma sp.]